MREETKSVAGWGPNLKVIRAVSTRSGLLALCCAVLTTFSVIQWCVLIEHLCVPGGTCLKRRIPCLETKCIDENIYLHKTMCSRCTANSPANWVRKSPVNHQQLTSSPEPCCFSAWELFFLFVCFISWHFITFSTCIQGSLEHSRGTPLNHRGMGVSG